MQNAQEPDCLSGATDTFASIDFVTPTFGEVYAATFRLVWRGARRLGVSNSSVDDVVQDVFLTVHRRLAQFAGRCSIENWVFGILLRVTRNYRRSRQRKGAAHAISSVVVDPDELVSADDPMDTVCLREASRIFQNMLSKLSQPHAHVWAMAKIEGMTPLEIAAATGLSVFTVYSRLRYARIEFDRHLSRLSCPADVRAARRRRPRSRTVQLSPMKNSAA